MFWVGVGVLVRFTAEKASRGSDRAGEGQRWDVSRARREVRSVCGGVRRAPRSGRPKPPEHRAACGKAGEKAQAWRNRPPADISACRERRSAPREHRCAPSEARVRPRSPRSVPRIRGGRRMAEPRDGALIETETDAFSRATRSDGHGAHNEEELRPLVWRLARTCRIRADTYRPPLARAGSIARGEAAGATQPTGA